MNKKTENKKLKMFLFLIPLIFLAAGCNKKATEEPQATQTITIAGHKLNVQVAQTVQDQEKGLGGRGFLAENDGMLFLFAAPGKVAFWMKDTLIPLDFIWIKDGKVAEITPDVQPEPNVSDSSLHIYLPAEEIDSTIEVNAGWAAKNEIKVGDKVIVSQP
jgi:uncharacterized membrane protein (UPF0127 family)